MLLCLKCSIIALTSRERCCRAGSEGNALRGLQPGKQQPRVPAMGRGAGGSAAGSPPGPLSSPQPRCTSLPSSKCAASGTESLSVRRKWKPRKKFPGPPRTQPCKARGGQCDLSTYFSLRRWQLPLKCACVICCSGVRPAWPAGASF